MAAKIEIKNSNNQWVDISGYLKADKGFKVTRNDLDSPKAGRTIGGKMVRGRKASKEKIECAARPLTQSESEILLNLIYPEFITVRYLSPRKGRVTGTFYSNNVPATFLREKPNGTQQWEDITFPLVEQ